MVKFELFDTVGENITVEGVKTFLNANKSNDIQFDISSLGGDLATAITIHDLIKAHPKNTVANIVGLTASAGTVIAIACDEVIMSDNALFLIHNGWKEMTGNVYDFQKAASDLMKTDAIMIKMYREKTGLEDGRIRDIMKASDWLSSGEALELGFVDRVVNSGIKIAASVLISGAQGKINNVVLTKLKEKMNIFGKKDKGQKPDVMNVLALKTGQALINAELPAAGVEIAPLGAMTLEDGEYELADGRKIVVAGGVITEVVEMQPEAQAATSDEMLAAVAAVVTDAVAKVKGEFMAELAKIKSVHVPPKGIVPVSAKADNPDVKSKVEGVAKAIKDKINESRKA